MLYILNIKKRVKISAYLIKEAVNINVTCQPGLE